MNVAVFRPDDERLDEAVTLLESLGVNPVPDPMLAVEPTGAVPRTGTVELGSTSPASQTRQDAAGTSSGEPSVAGASEDTVEHSSTSPRSQAHEDADFTILTSKTGVELAANAGWRPGDTTLCAIGDATAAACRETGWDVDLVPDEYTSSGLVAALEDDVAGARVEVARSDHGSDVLTDGLNDAGAFVHETVLYELVRPNGAGESVEFATSGDLDAALFTSSLTVEHWLDAASERGVREQALSGLNDVVVGCIGAPTRETAEENGISVDLVPPDADFEQLARAVCDSR